MMSRWTVLGGGVLIALAGAMIAVMQTPAARGVDVEKKEPKAPAVVELPPITGVYISEFLAVNIGGLTDEDGKPSPWIELHNPTQQAVDLKGYFLTDDSADPIRWPIGDGQIEAGGYLVVFASGKDRGKSAPAHANFFLKPVGYLALAKDEGRSIAWEYKNYPKQEADISFGIDTGGGRAKLRSFATASPGKANQRAEVVISEIHYDPAVRTDRVEFLELHNPGTVAVDLSGAKFDKGIDYSFPDRTSLAPGGYLVVAQDPAVFTSRFGSPALGPWTGTLSNNGEKVVLLNKSGGALDRVDYGAGFPWPTVGLKPARSIRLVNPDFDNDLAGNWIAGRPSGVQAQQENAIFESRSQWRFRRGKLSSFYTGISFDDRVSRQILSRMRIEGALVLGVRPNSPADRAGLRGTQRDPRDGSFTPGDIIQEVNGRKLRSADDFNALLQRSNAGEVVTLTVLRGNQTIKIPLTLEAAGQ